jgi:hypothetical protein
MLHLAWHFDLRDEEAPSDYFWNEVSLDVLNRRVLAAAANAIGTKRDNIPYGLDTTGACFDPTNGDFIPPPIGKGLTCATFIVAVFGSYGFDLLDEASWPTHNAEDEGWQSQIIETLRSNGAHPAHIEAMERDVGSSRFKPDEVVGSSTLPTWPVAFPEARSIADEIISLIAAASDAA